MEKIRSIGEMWKGMKREDREVADAHMLLKEAHRLGISDDRFAELWNTAYRSSIRTIESHRAVNSHISRLRLMSEEDIENIAGGRADVLTLRAMRRQGYYGMTLEEALKDDLKYLNWAPLGLEFQIFPKHLQL